MLRQLIQVENSARGLGRTELWLSGTVHALQHPDLVLMTRWAALMPLMVKEFKTGQH